MKNPNLERWNLFVKRAAAREQIVNKLVLTLSVLRNMPADETLKKANEAVKNSTLNLVQYLQNEISKELEVSTKRVIQHWTTEKEKKTGLDLGKYPDE